MFSNQTDFIYLILQNQCKVEIERKNRTWIKLEQQFHLRITVIKILLLFFHAGFSQLSWKQEFYIGWICEVKRVTLDIKDYL